MEQGDFFINLIYLEFLMSQDNSYILSCGKTKYELIGIE